LRDFNISEMHPQLFFGNFVARLRFRAVALCCPEILARNRKRVGR
jgi:hypothetical protein